jgi:GT2 family glycosyltransferase
LKADESLERCILSLMRQTWRELDVVIVDNSGRGLVRARGLAGLPVRVIEAERNLGYGGAVNRGFLSSAAPYLGTINDDAEADPFWIESLVTALEEHPEAGSAASRVLLNRSEMDSAGMLVAADGSSKQRGHGQPPYGFDEAAEVLCPSGSAALYRRRMLEEVGMFDEEFFAYCEDTDLGLRAAWAGWTCRYVPEAVVEHHYSYSAGKASRFKAYHVERNRIYVVMKNFPWRMVWESPLHAVERYFWHGWYVLLGQGAAAQFQKEGGSAIYLGYLVFRAHLSALFRMPRLLRLRRLNRGSARLDEKGFMDLIERHSISLRQVAEL